ncbi:EAL domain-containing protein [Alteromonas sp. 345S023]|uniref:EAL domain-containing protein n=2 Tax=Alteromonas profundi TaxID=2696062 RepID=A0A7X5LIK4_9ALTE|nr:EAL domain-containing protein [Alteromonas profundi]
MKLSSQLSVSLLVFLIAVFLGSFLINIKLTQEYVHEQLATHAQDTATSLGLSITPYVSEDGGLPIAETMINAIFDRGYYQSILLSDLDGNQLVIRENPNKIDTVPEWFTDIIEVDPPVKETELSNGWNMAGYLAVKSHPGLANEKLWESIKQSAAMFSFAFAIAYVALFFIIRAITKPLSIVTTKISDIQRLEFSQIEYKPFTKELSFIVLAINKLSASVEAMFKELSEKAEQFKSIAFEDNVTGLMNRNAFKRHLNALLSSSAAGERGYLIIVRLAQLSHVNNMQGAAQGDEYLKRAVSVLQSLVSDYHDKANCFRVSGADFAICMEGIPQNECALRVEELAQKLSTVDMLKDGSKVVWVGGTEFTSGDSFSEVMEKADSALLASTRLDRCWQLASKLSYIQSNTEWRTRLNRIISHQHADIFLQPIINVETSSAIYHEGFARFKDVATNEYIPMSQLIPASERLNLIPKVDTLVTTLISRKLHGSNLSIAVNLSTASICDPEFTSWLSAFLNDNKEIGPQLVFEIEDDSLIHNKQSVIAFTNLVRSFKARITIEHFGANLASLTGLRAIHPDYVKISGNLTKDINESGDNQLFISSLVSIATSLQISVISELVESEEESSTLKNLKVINQQGYYHARPELWK